MKILFLVHQDIIIYNFRLELVERILLEGHEVWISSPYGDRIEELKKMGCHFLESKVSRHGTNPITDFKLLKHYKKTIRTLSPDIVFTYCIKPNIYGSLACKSNKVPYVVNITGLGMALENKGWLQIITVMLYKIALKNVQTVFFQNEENRQFFEKKKIALGKHKMLPGSGVNLNRFSLVEYPKDTKIKFAFIARIMKEKGIDEYLEAAKAIKTKYPNTEFHICGFCEKEYNGKLYEYGQKGWVNYHGMVKDVREIYKDVHCIIHPTYYPEGIANVLLESCASGRPIITTNRSGCREVIDDGVNGFIVEEKNSKDLVKKIEKFITLTYEQKRAMGLAGRQKVEKEFSRNIVVEKYIAEIKGIKR